MVAKRLFLVLLCLTVMAAPAFGAAKDVIYASESTPKSLDPHDTTDTYSGAIEKAMLEGLMGFDKDLKVIPLLAESYTFNSAATEFTFKLRKGITVPRRHALQRRGRAREHRAPDGRQAETQQPDEAGQGAGRRRRVRPSSSC